MILELLLEGADFELHRPRARILMREVPVSLRNRLGLEEIAVLQRRLAPASARYIDTAVNVNPGDMDTLGAEITRERLRQPTHRELRGPERDRLRPGLDAGRRASEEHRAAPARDHRGRHLFGRDKRAQRVDAPVGLVIDPA